MKQSPIISLIAYPLGLIMWLLYSIMPNYGIVILGFTLITKLLLFPMSLHQHKSIISRTKLQPQMAEIKNKYGKNPQKYQEEIMALYQREHINPISGCGLTLIQFPIFFGMLGVVYAPLKYILRLSDDIINKATVITQNLLGSNFLSQSNSRNTQYIIIKTLRDMPEAYKNLGQDIINKILNLNFNFLGMDLSKSPSIPHSLSALNLLILIPVLTCLFSLLFSIQSLKNSESTTIDETSQKAMRSTKPMMFIMPIISAWFSFTFPAGIGLYLIFSNIFSIIQNHILYKKYNPKEIILKAKEEIALKKEQERLERIEAKKRLNSGEMKEGDQIKGISQKESNKIKLANARKRDAEKYGDYND